jgi:hypothetical protein
VKPYLRLEKKAKTAVMAVLESLRVRVKRIIGLPLLKARSIKQASGFLSKNLITVYTYA